MNTEKNYYKSIFKKKKKSPLPSNQFEVKSDHSAKSEAEPAELAAYVQKTKNPQKTYNKSYSIFKTKTKNRFSPSKSDHSAESAAEPAELRTRWTIRWKMRNQNSAHTWIAHQRKIVGSQKKLESNKSPCC